MKLFEISTHYQQLMNEISECDELTAEQLQAIESVDDSLQEKAKAVGAFIKNMEADLFAIQDAINTMEKRSSTLCGKIEHLKAYLKDNLERCDIKEIKSPYFDIRIKSNPAAVVVQDEALVPEYYFRSKLIRNLDKTLLSQELKNNVMIPGVTLEKRTRIEIR
mgnify:CR=1 FL=1